ncbi:MAG: serine/threonine protein kinase [Deltaproteobacteria bacterium]|nr:serine/threonine protein kinase [Deltaproteobacteria bacterium]
MDVVRCLPPPIPVRPPTRLARGTGSRAAQGEAFGPYVVHEQLGAGGMASVHRAEQRGIAGFSKPVALKRMFDNFADDPSFVQSFATEAQLASLLRHDHIAQAYDFGKVGSTYYIAMELVPGPTLQEMMNRARASGIAIAIPIIVEILIQLCDALDHAHNLCDDAGVPLGIIHRDVSPSNVIIADAGMVKLIDFGIAKATSSRSTNAGVIKGKFGYIAPEYTRGQIDARADLFALGVLAHELLTGKRLFTGDNDFATLVAVREGATAPPSRTNKSVPAGLDDIVMTALQRDPDLRWQTASAMRNALGSVARRLGAAVGGQRIREWIECEEVHPTHDDDGEPSVIVTMFGPEDTGVLVAPVPPRPRGRSWASQLIAVLVFAAVAVAVWQAWSVLVVWSASG